MPGDTIHFLSFSEGLSLRHARFGRCNLPCLPFPFLFGGAFIEATPQLKQSPTASRFPFLFGGTFIEAHRRHRSTRPPPLTFPFLFEGTFIEAPEPTPSSSPKKEFPFLFGGTFIEAHTRRNQANPLAANFPSFSEGLSLRRHACALQKPHRRISLPFRRDFH